MLSLIFIILEISLKIGDMSEMISINEEDMFTGESNILLNYFYFL